MNKPSKQVPGIFLYDDFAYTHTKEGTNSHYAAAFLAWHRWFLHLYETALVEECGYKGVLAYWDWSLDSADISASPIWANEEGFGGDGDPDGLVSVFNGRCVVDGPFANTTRHWLSESHKHSYGIHAQPHCLSRGFKRDAERKKALESRVSPPAIQEILDQPTYSEFFAKLEVSAHNAIPQLINGDFFGLTAPNDPVFYMHHAQLDRLWWKWQMLDPTTRQYQFEGPTKNFRLFNSTVSNSSIEDQLYYGDLHRAIKAKDVMSTVKGDLCYLYSDT